jgi:hypothetical protein
MNECLNNLRSFLEVINNCKITCDLYLIPISGQYTNEDLKSGYQYQEPTFKNTLINKIHAGDFLHNCKELQIQFIQTLHNEINLSKDPLLNFRLYNSTIKEISNLIVSLRKRRTYHLTINNLNDVPSISKEYFNGILSNQYSLIINHLINEVLQPTEEEIKKELNFLSNQTPNNALKKEPLNTIANNKPHQIFSFKDMFVEEALAEPCFDILKKIDPPYVNQANEYIGNCKGIFSLWYKVLNEMGNIVKPKLSSIELTNAIESRLPNIKLSKDGSTFRKTYKRLDEKSLTIGIKTLFSQFSPPGRLGK